jgi:hypothetical protein
MMASKKHAPSTVRNDKDKDDYSIALAMSDSLRTAEDENLKQACEASAQHFTAVNECKRESSSSRESKLTHDFQRECSRSRDIEREIIREREHSRELERELLREREHSRRLQRELELAKKHTMTVGQFEVGDRSEKLSQLKELVYEHSSLELAMKEMLKYQDSNTTTTRMMFERLSVLNSEIFALSQTLLGDELQM